MASEQEKTEDATPSLTEDKKENVPPGKEDVAVKDISSEDVNKQEMPDVSALKKEPKSPSKSSKKKKKKGKGGNKEGNQETRQDKSGDTVF